MIAPSLHFHTPAPNARELFVGCILGCGTGCATLPVVARQNPNRTRPEAMAPVLGRPEASSQGMGLPVSAIAGSFPTWPKTSAGNPGSTAARAARIDQ